MVEKSPDEIIAGIREVLDGYKVLKKLNPKQDIEFVVKHLSKIFDKGKNEKEQVDLVPTREGAETEVLSKIKMVYNVFKTLSRLAPEEAPAILIQNLDEILLKLRKEEVQREPIQSDVVVCQSEAEENKDEDKSVQDVEMEKTSDLEKMDAAHCSNLEPKPNNLETFKPPLENLPKSDPKFQNIQQQKFSTCSKKETSLVKTPTLKKFQTNLTIYFCKFCNRWFTNSIAKHLHQNFCHSSSSLKSRAESQITNSNPTSRLFISPQVDSNSNFSLIKQVQITSEKTTPPNSNPNAVNENPEEKLRKLVSTATVTTLTNSGASVSMIAGRGHTYKCHLCTEISTPVECESLELLADPVRTSHRPEVPPPFSCLHQGCQLKFSDSSDFRGHVKEPHDKVQKSSKISEPASAAKSVTESAEESAPIAAVEKGGKIYKCEYCRRDLSNSTALIRHIRIHTEERPFACLRCSDRFSVKTALDDHMEKIHGQQIKNSPSASVSGFAPSSVSVSVSAVDEIPSFSSSEEVPKSKTLEEKSDDGEKIIISPLKASPSLTENTTDEKEGEENPPELELEPEIQITEVEVEVETEEEKNPDLDLDDKPHLDSIPSASSASSSAHPKTTEIKQAHVFVPPAPKKYQYQCVECNRTFHNHGHFMAHARRHAHEEAQKNPLTCVLCDEEFDNIQNRKMHEISEHSRNGRFYCDICGSGYLNVPNLLAHSLLHCY